jgi:hypothetical protein
VAGRGSAAAHPLHHRGGVSFDARLTRRSAVGTVTLRDGRELPFSAKAGDGGGVVGRRFTHQGRRYRSGFVVLRGNAVRWAITPVGRGLYGDSPPTAWNAHYNRLGQAIGALDEAIFALDQRTYDCG